MTDEKEAKPIYTLHTKQYYAYQNSCTPSELNIYVGEHVMLEQVEKGRDWGNEKDTIHYLDYKLAEQV